VCVAHLFSFVLSFFWHVGLRFVFCAQCCMCLRGVHSWSFIQFTLTFISEHIFEKTQCYVLTSLLNHDIFSINIKQWFKQTYVLFLHWPTLVVFWFAYLSRVKLIVGSIPIMVKPNTKKALPGSLSDSIMCPSKATCLKINC